MPSWPMSMCANPRLTKCASTRKAPSFSIVFRPRHRARLAAWARPRHRRGSRQVRGGECRAIWLPAA